MLLYSNLPATPVSGLRREIDTLFDDIFGRTLAAPNGNATWAPVADVRADERGYTFAFEIPGVLPEKVEVRCDNGILTVRGEKLADSTNEVQDNQGSWLVSERQHGSFVRSFRLPGSTDETRVEARFMHGVLTVRVPKAELPQPRKIQIATT